MSVRGFDVIIGANTSGFEAGVKRVQQQLGKLPNASNQATLALSNLSRVAQDAPYGFIGIANNLNPLLESFQRLKATSGSTGGALKALASSLGGAGGIGLALGIASSLAVVFGDKLFGAGRAAKAAKTAADELKDSIKGIFKESAKEAAEVTSLIALLNSETETRGRKLAAIKELQKIQPEVFAGLKLEGDAVIGLDSAYKNYLENLRSVIAAKILQAKLEQLIIKQLELQGATATGATKVLLDGTKKIADSQRKKEGGYLSSFVIAEDKKNAILKGIEEDIKDIVSQLGEVTKGVKVPELKIEKLKIKPKRAEVDLDRLDLDTAEESFKKFLAAEKGRFRIPAILDFEQSGPNKELPKGVGDGIKRIQDQVLAMNNKIKKSFDELQAMANLIANSISNAFGQAFDNIAKGENVFKAVGEALKDMILQLIKAAIQAFIVKKILSLFAPGLGGPLGNLSSFALGGHAAGGPVAAGRPTWVGETGREVFVPSTAGRIVPNNQLGSLAGSATPVINLYGSMGISMNQLKYSITKVEQKQSRVG